MDDPLSSTSTVESSTSRARSFGGCGTCRSRHIKCDETRPNCIRCVMDSIECNGYSRTIFFDAKDDDGKARYRQTLFTDEERKKMNLLMTERVPMQKALTVVAEIENECERAVQRSAKDIGIFRGPFGVFKLKSRSLDHGGNQTQPDLVIAYPQSNSPELDLSNSEIFEIPGWLDASSLLDLNESSLMQSIFLRNTSTPGPFSESQFTSMFYDDNSFADMLHIPPAMTELSNEASILHDAPFLLKHYADNFIPSLTPFRHSKTPWHILFLPSAKNTLANMTIGHETGSADLVTFFGILSISALNLNQHDSGQKWQVQAAVLKYRAEEYMKIVLEHALDIPKSYKYKSILMAILTMIQISMVEGSWHETDTYLFEAEKLVRLRGLTRVNKSRKVRLLHHCYAYMRIFQESLSFSSLRSPLRRTLMVTVQNSGMVAKGSDTPSFRLISWGDDLEKRFRDLKTREEGENDLHLGSPGFWPNTLYPEIFGVPETWLNLLSQVIRLSNEKEISDSSDGPTLSLKEFTLRAKALERYILRWDGTTRPSGAINGLQVSDVDWVLLESMQKALHHALIIYFYRRIHDVHPELLQHKVEKVKELLLVCKNVCNSGASLDALMWPAFVAGCEAVEPKLQQDFAEWFNHSLQHSSRQSSFARLRQIMHHVWDLMQKDDKKQTSWLQLLKEDDVEV